MRLLISYDAMTIKVVGICGGHKRGGASELFCLEALKSCEEAGASTDFIHLADYEIEPCQACFDCAPQRAGRCVLEDDFEEVSKRLLEADGLIVCSPVYFGLVSGKLKNFMDRTISLRVNGFKLRNKVGGAIAVGAARGGGQETTLLTIIVWMLTHDMIVVGNGAPGAHIGAVCRARHPADAPRDERGILEARKVGRRVFEAAELIARSQA
ncbi:MAG TPA: flavodoxin family protein [Nitrososphaeria archaeon]|nr:flavodoxin family protein [Nitrososphaeria archaeon]